MTDWGRQYFRDSENVSRETMDRLQILVDMLVKWNRSAGLVADATLEEVWERHILDSYQLLDHFPFGIRKVVDIGTGGGFPGLVLAIATANRHPHAKFVLVDSNGRKCEFLREVCRQTGIDAEIVQSRAEQLAPQKADVMTARALARLDKLLELAQRHTKRNGMCLFLKGKNWSDEITAATSRWKFQFMRQQSRSNEDGQVLLVRKVQSA